MTLRPGRDAARPPAPDRVWRTTLWRSSSTAALVLLAAWLPGAADHHHQVGHRARPNPLVIHCDHRPAVAYRAKSLPLGAGSPTVISRPGASSFWRPCHRAGDWPTHIAVGGRPLPGHLPGRRLGCSAGCSARRTPWTNDANRAPRRPARRSRSKARRPATTLRHDHILSIPESVPTVPAASPSCARARRGWMLAARVPGRRQGRAPAREPSVLWAGGCGRLRRRRRRRRRSTRTRRAPQRRTGRLRGPGERAAPGPAAGAAPGGAARQESRAPPRCNDGRRRHHLRAAAAASTPIARPGPAHGITGSSRRACDVGGTAALTRRASAPP